MAPELSDLHTSAGRMSRSAPGRERPTNEEFFTAATAVVESEARYGALVRREMVRHAAALRPASERSGQVLVLPARPKGTLGANSRPGVPARPPTANATASAGSWANAGLCSAKNDAGERIYRAMYVMQIQIKHTPVLRQQLSVR